ncbi:MAG: methylenetetrahydrofolate reductase [NAD(P)H] [Vulcanimicrobiaceae bacterium]|jgi:methylenetetrahydrofolate reductase (NADPH)
MRIIESLEQRQPFFSFEFFPPQNDDGVRLLFDAIAQLRVLQPAFVSITYGAGGSTRARTVELAKRIRNDLGIDVMAHVTCVGATRDELRALFDDLAAANIENIMALRGDPPKGEGAFSPPKGGFAYASELIAMLSKEYTFCIGAACYPETHPQAFNAETDLRNAVEKVRAGADFLTTQLFFDNERYFTFVQRARGAGITVPILPGIMPITDYAQIKRFTEVCGVEIPLRLRSELERRVDEPAAVGDLGVAYATLQCADLLARGAPGIHFYTLNRSPATRAVCSALRAASRWPGLTLA